LDLYKHQKEIIDKDIKCCGLFLGTGSGKTLTALLLARGTTLVICPKTQRDDGNWQRELLKNNINLDLTVISKEDFRRDWELLPKFHTVICDEAHTMLGVLPTMKWVNRQQVHNASQMFEALEKYLIKNMPVRFYLCTATIMKSPLTVWAAAKLIGYRIDYYSFRNAFYFRLPMPGREVWRMNTDEDSKERLATIINKIGYVGRLEDYFDVPEQTFVTKYINLTIEQKKRIKELKMEFPEPLVRCGKIHQVESGILAGDEFNPPESFYNGKLDRILELALEFPQMIIFAKYTRQIKEIVKVLKDEGYFVESMTGETETRGKILADLKLRQKYIFVVQAQISSGWELPLCPVIVFASRTYSFVDAIQSKGRILRADALKKNLYISLVVKDGVDEMVEDAINNKQDFSEKIYEAQRG
jgi:hypothetical protein